MKQGPDSPVDPERIADLSIFYNIVVKAYEDDFPIQVRVLDQRKPMFCKGIHQLVSR
jgi:hypothetical protein